MENNEIKRLDMESVDIVSSNIRKIEKIFPNVIKEGKIDFNALKQELSNDVIDDKKEKYQLTWAGKGKAVLEANLSINKTLRPVKEKSINFDGTKNVYIEGDNLETLKILQESYLNKIKCIYIDPPYNTGNDFVYNDKFNRNEKEELSVSGQIDDYNNRLVSNTDSNGRFHSDWLNMVYPRIKLARNLLTSDGVIFISIDDNEQENMKKICNEIFGERNFVAQLVWEKKKKGAFLSKNFINMKEYILVYCKNDSFFKGLIGEINSESETYPCIKTTNARGIRVIRKGTLSRAKESNYEIKSNTRISSGNMELIYLDDLIVKNNIVENDVRIDSNWIYSQSALDEYHNKGLLYVTQDYYIRRIVNEDRIKMLKDLLLRVGNDGKSYSTYTFDKNLNNGGWGTNEDANDEVHKILNQQYLFDYSKPSRLICKLLQSVNDKNCIILDFFSGSATTAHSVMKLNSIDNGRRKYIMVQLPEICEKSNEFNTICDLGEERIRRAAKKIKEETNADIDYGFRVYKVDSSNMKDIYYEPSKLNQAQLNMFESNIKEDRTAEDLLTQVILDLGLTLDLRIEEKNILNNKVYYVAENSLVACFDNEINIDILNQICEIKPLKVVFRESSFRNDSDKINAYERIKKLSPETEISVI